MQTIVVDGQGTKLAYLDSGAPSTTSYTTLFAIHGQVFASRIWDKVMALASMHGLRIVAVNRRDYEGSTPFTADDIKTIQSGTDKEKEALLCATSVEMATFIDLFTQQHHIPPLSPDSKSGGFAIVTWSMGNCVGLGVAAYVGALPSDVQQRIGANLRAIIMLEAPDSALGMDMLPQSYTPLVDEAIPFDLRIPFWQTWITAYFKHGDLSKRDVNEISFVVPWNIRAPSIYNMSEEQLAKMADPSSSWTSELPAMMYMKAQLYGIYKRACFDKNVRALLPRMKIWAAIGDRGVSYATHGYFNMQNDNDDSGGGSIEFKIISGVNHFMLWDEPETTIDTLLSTLTQS